VTDAPVLIASAFAPARLLASRPDLARKKRQRRRAAAVAGSVGREVAALDVLAGWLSTNTDQDVEDLESLLSDRVTVHLAGLDPADRAGANIQTLHAELALDLGWRALQGHGPREVMRVLALAGPEGAPRSTVERVARAGAGAVDDVLRAAFALADGDRITPGPGLLPFVRRQTNRPVERRERLQRWLTAVRTDLDHGVPDIEDAARRAMDLALSSSQGDLAAAIALSLAGRLRSQRNLEGARQAAKMARASLGGAEPRVAALRAAVDLELALINLASGNVAAAEERLDLVEETLLGASKRDAEASARLQARVRIVRAQCHLSEGRPLAALAELQTPASGVLEVVRLHCLASAHLGLDRGEATQFAVAAADAASGALPAESPLGAAVALTQAQLSVGPHVDELLERARVLAGGNLDRAASPTLALALHELGVRAAGTGDLAAAATLLDEASMLAASLLPRRHPLPCTIAYTRGLLLLSAGEPARAERHLERATEGWDNLGGRNHPSAILARAARSWLDAAEPGRTGRKGAAQLRQDTEALAELLGVDHPAVRRLQELHSKCV
jgi:hypothetical protein